MCEVPSLFDERIRKANKQHKCYECHSPIVKGEKYHDIKGLWDGRFDNFKIHKDCQEFRLTLEKDFSPAWNDYIAYGELHEAIGQVVSDKFLKHWLDEDGCWQLNRYTISEMKTKYEFEKL